MLYTFAAEFRQDLSTDATLLKDKDLPEVQGYRIAKSAEMQAAVAIYNQRKYEQGLARQLARLQAN